MTDKEHLLKHIKYTKSLNNVSCGYLFLTALSKNNKKININLACPVEAENEKMRKEITRIGLDEELNKYYSRVGVKGYRGYFLLTNIKNRP